MPKSWEEEAESDARDCFENFVDEMADQVADVGEASDDLNNDYPGGDSYHHENHVDEAYNLTDAAAILDELGRWEETDSGLWERQNPRDAISTQAAFTYGNAVYDKWRDMVKELNEFIADIDEPEFTPPAGMEPDDFDHAEAREYWLKRVVRAYVALVCHEPGPDESPLHAGCLSALSVTGNLQPLGAYADWLDEHGQGHTAKRFRDLAII